jgi:hypothetical protein
MGAATGVTTVQNNLTVAGNLTVQGTTTQVNSTVTNVSDPIFTIGTGPNGANPVADDNRDRGIAFKWHNGTAAQTGFFGYDDSTGFMTFVPNATLANEVVSGTKGAIDVNLAGGTAQSLVYQSAANTTAFLAAGTSGHILQTNGTGSAPSWVPTSGLSAGTADTVKTVQQTANGNYFPTFVDSNNATALGEVIYTTSSFVINPSTGNVGIGTGAPAARLDLGLPTAISQVHAVLARPGPGGDTNFRLVASSGAGTAINTEFFKFGIDYSGTQNAHINFFRGGSSTGGFITFTTNNNTERMRIDTAGDVGIGTSPVFSGGSGLEIQRVGTATLRLDSGTFATEFRAQTNGTEIFQLSAGYLDLGTSAATRVRITSAGDVGIGVTAPTKRLQVESGATATGGQAWSHSAGTVYARLGVVNPGVSNDTEFGTVSNNNLRFLTNNAERAQIDTVGNLLVNLTAAGTNGRLQVAGSIGLSGNTQIRQVSNADGNTLQVFATQFVAAATNSGSIGYTAGGLIASVSAAASQILLDVGGQTAGHRLRVTNGGDGIQGRLAYSNFGVERFAVDSTTGNTFISTTTNATSVSSGALQVVGGAGIGGSLFVGNAANLATGVSGDVALMGTANSRVIVSAGGGNSHIRSESGDFSLRATTSALGGLTIAAAGGTVTINSNTNATSTITGALRVIGGVGIGGNLHVGGTIFGAVSGSSDSATNAANVAVTNDNATTTDQYVTFVAASSGNNPIKVSATTGLVWKPNTGSLGLGVSPSLGKLHVVGKGYFSTEVQANSAIINSASVNGTNSAIFGSNSGAVPILITRNVSTTGTDLYINSTGDVSIGTYSASAKFGVAGPATGTTAGNQSMVQRLLSATGNNDALEFSNVRGTAGSDWTTAGFRIQQKVDSTWMGFMQFNGTASGVNSGGISFGSGTTTASANSVAERMRITPAGDVGIGTVSPSTRLSVQASAANGIALLQDTGAATNSGRLFFQASGGTYALYNLNNVLQFASGATIGSSSGTARMALNSSGFLGVGTTLAPLTFLDVRSNNSSALASQVSGFTLRTNENNGMEWHLQHSNGYTGWVAAARVNNNGASFGQGFLEFITAGSSGGNQVSTMALHGNGNVSIGSTAVPAYKLFVNGSFAATTKSFVIDHPTKTGHKLRYGSLEGPENGVYVRGRLKDNNVIELPDYWTGLVDEDSITVDLTPIGKHQNLYVADIADNTVTVGSETDQLINCFYTVWAERKDVDKLVVEYKEQEI